jgi:hypothetical protein
MVQLNKLVIKVLLQDHPKISSVHSPSAETLWVPNQNARNLFRYLEVRFRTMGLLAQRYWIGTLELEFGTLEIRIFEMDVWMSGFLEWMSGCPVFFKWIPGPRKWIPGNSVPILKLKQSLSA